MSPSRRVVVSSANVISFRFFPDPCSMIRLLESIDLTTPSVVWLADDDVLLVLLSVAAAANPATGTARIETRTMAAVRIFCIYPSWTHFAPATLKRGERR